jgi:hypothetical protein
MTSAVALALMAKAMAVFGGDDTYLSFPLTPLSFTKEQLDFLNDAAHPSAALENASQFARIVNQIPSGPVWPTVDTGPLWDEYSRILRLAELAVEQRTPAEEAQYQAAMAFLYVVGVDGLQVPSAAVLAYNQYRDAYLNAKQQYASRTIAANASTDPAVKAQYATDQPGLQAAEDAALSAWQTQGFKGQVDDARRTQLSLGAKSPAITWSQWAASCDPDVVAETDLENQHFMPTAFAPSSAIDSPVWQQFSLGSAEVAQLMKTAPGELAARLGSDQQQIDVESVDFECTSVSLVRPWFSSDLFAARFWKLNSAPNVISDGGTPPHGTIPGYTVAIVFARNLQVKLSGSSSAPAASGEPVTIGPLHAVTVIDGTGNRIFMRPAVASVVPRFTAERIMPAAQPAAQPAMSAAAARPMMFRPAFAMREPIARPFVAEAVAAPPPAAAAAPPARAQGLMMLRSMNFARLEPPPEQPPPQTGTPPPQGGTAPPPPPAPDQTSDVIFVLGFICKAVPLCPNPDPSLAW